MGNEIFDDRAFRYDALVDWDKRLANEAPFYRRLFEENHVESVLDAACGSGRHAELFHSWGLRVEGADISGAMIAHCRQRFGESATLRWVERSFDRPGDPPGAFDAVICVGNSLALADEEITVRRVVEALFASLCPGGVCVIQVLNTWAMPEGETVWKKCKRLTTNDEDHVFIKGMRRTGSRVVGDVIDLKLDEGGVESEFSTFSFTGIEPETLVADAEHAGGVNVTLLGDYQHRPYVRDESMDLILVAQRGES